MSCRILLCVFIAVLSASLPLVCGQSGPKLSWKDSFSLNGKCYCETTFDHSIGSYTVTDTSIGEEIDVKTACARVGKPPSSEQGERRYFNDIQCGNGPANDAGDEDWCPGRVDMGTNDKTKCDEKGPKWVFPGGEPDTPVPATPVPDPPAAEVLNSLETPASQFVEEEEPAVSGGVLTMIVVTDMADGTTTPLGDKIIVSDYPQGFNLRAEVTDENLIQDVRFSSNGISKTETTHTYDMFGSNGSWPNPTVLVGGTVVVTVVANKVVGTSETIIANIDFE